MARELAQLCAVRRIVLSRSEVSQPSPDHWRHTERLPAVVLRGNAEDDLRHPQQPREPAACETVASAVE